MPFKVYLNIILLLLIYGCTSAPIQEIPRSAAPKPTVTHSVEPANQKEKSAQPKVGMEQETLRLGKVFAKTQFEGVVKKGYVKLKFYELGRAQRSYELIIGDKDAHQKNFPWTVQTVEPGYFFIELPEGRYSIHSISIPVDTTFATETMDIEFEVKEGSCSYLGSLEVVGIAEKVKLGGVPLVQPGFEYRLHLKDERGEAFREFNARFPDAECVLETNLMNLNSSGNI